jgi:hypothetical protein
LAYNLLSSPQNVTEKSIESIIKMKDTYTNKAGLVSGDTAAKSPIATQASVTSATPRAFQISEVEVSGNTSFLRRYGNGPTILLVHLFPRTSR